MPTLNTTQIVQQFEKEIGLPQGFYNQIHADDDWSFVIKVHALFEAAVAKLLSTAMSLALQKYSFEGLQQQSLDSFVSWLELSKPKTGKLALGEALGLISAHERKFIRRLSELRNDIVHDVKNVGFQFSAYVKQFDTNQRHNFTDAFGYGIASTEELTKFFGKPVSQENFILDNPKSAIWLSGLACLEGIARVKKLVVDEKYMQQVQSTVFDRIFQVLKSMKTN